MFLNSGGFRKHPKLARIFLAEMVDGHGKNPKILISIFAETRETWTRRYHKTIAFFTELLPDDVVPIYEMATDDDFENQVAQNSIIFFYGGDVEVLASRLQHCNIPAIFKGKTIAGTSAGSAVWGNYYWEPYTPKIRPALGVIPIKFIPHFKADDNVDWDKILKEVEEHSDHSDTTHALEEGYFVVIEQ